MHAETIVLVRDEAGIVEARQCARRLSAELGFGLMDQSRVTTAVSELARNVVRFAVDSSGTVSVRVVTGAEGEAGIEVVVEDEGPGIDDLAQAMQQGWSSGRGLGLGLSGTKRLMDEMHLDSRIGVGTKVTIRKWLRPVHVRAR